MDGIPSKLKFDLTSFFVLFIAFSWTFHGLYSYTILGRKFCTFRTRIYRKNISRVSNPHDDDGFDVRSVPLNQSLFNMLSRKPLCRDILPAVSVSCETKNLAFLGYCNSRKAICTRTLRRLGNKVPPQSPVYCISFQTASDATRYPSIISFSFFVKSSRVRPKRAL